MLTEDEANLVKVTARENRGMSTLALSRHLSFPYRDVLTVINPESVLADSVVSNPIASAPKRRPELEPYIIARRDCFSGWSDRDRPRIEAARIGYDEGILEMCQGRAGAMILLYAIPRRIPAERRDYFSRRD
jgi:hypothetical protein